MLDKLDGKTRKKVNTLLKGIFTIITPLLLIIITFYFLGTVDAGKDDILFKIIKYGIYALDFVAIVIITRNVIGMLYDLEILKSKQHKVKIKEDD